MASTTNFFAALGAASAQEHEVKEAANKARKEGRGQDYEKPRTRRDDPTQNYEREEKPTAAPTKPRKPRAPRKPKAEPVVAAEPTATPAAEPTTSVAPTTPTAPDAPTPKPRRPRAPRKKKEDPNEKLVNNGEFSIFNEPEPAATPALDYLGQPVKPNVVNRERPATTLDTSEGAQPSLGQGLLGIDPVSIAGNKARATNLGMLAARKAKMQEYPLFDQGMVADVMNPQPAPKGGLPTQAPSSVAPDQGELPFREAINTTLAERAQDQRGLADLRKVHQQILESKRQEHLKSLYALDNQLRTAKERISNPAFKVMMQSPSHHLEYKKEYADTLKTIQQLEQQRAGIRTELANATANLAEFNTTGTKPVDLSAPAPAAPTAPAAGGTADPFDFDAMGATAAGAPHAPPTPPAPPVAAEPSWLSKLMGKMRTFKQQGPIITASSAEEQAKRQAQEEAAREMAEEAAATEKKRVINERTKADAQAFGDEWKKDESLTWLPRAPAQTAKTEFGEGDNQIEVKTPSLNDLEAADFVPRNKLEMVTDRYWKRRPMGEGRLNDRKFNAASEVVKQMMLDKAKEMKVAPPPEPVGPKKDMDLF